MDDYIDIEINENESNSSNIIQLPTNFIKIGEVANDDVKVYIKQDTYKALEKYALEDTSKERGTILLGDYCEEMGKTHVIISDYIEAKYTDASASTLTFTHETWDYVYKEHDSKYPDKKIIGWQHTHPSYGIFLSNYDLFIQENFFNLPFQIAYVIDPIQSLRGFFQWKNGKIEKLNGFYIYDDNNKNIKISQGKQADKKALGGAPAVKRLCYIFVAILIVILGVEVALGINITKSNNQIVKQQDHINTLIEQNEDLNNQMSIMSRFQDVLSKLILGENKREDVEELIAIVENDSFVINNKDALLEGLSNLLEKGADCRLVRYTVTAGDSLYKICEDHNIDYESNIRFILSINEIDNPNHIQAGQSIILPLE